MDRLSEAILVLLSMVLLELFSAPIYDHETYMIFLNVMIISRPDRCVLVLQYA